MDRKTNYSKSLHYEDPQNRWNKEIVDNSERSDSGIDSILDSGNFSGERFASSGSDICPERLNLNNSIPSRTDEGKVAALQEDRLDSGLPEEVSDSFVEKEQEQENEEVIQQMLQWFLPDEEGDTSLQLAIIQKKSNLAFDVIQSCMVPDLLNFANELQQTALHLAVLTDQPQLVRCLVVYGAKTSCKDREGNTPLHLACQQGLPVHVDMLTSQISSNEATGYIRKPLTTNVNERNYEGYSPLHLAAMRNHVKVMKLLIRNLHCDVNICDVKSGRTALHHAIECRNYEASKCLLENRVDANALTYDECSALHLAAAKGLRKECRLLLEHGADIFLITLDDYDVFELASHNRCLLDTLRDAEKRQYRRSPLTSY